MLIFQIHITLNPERIDAFKTATQQLAEQTINEAGNTRFELVQQVNDLSRFVMFEGYEDKAAMQAHMQGIPFMLWKSSVESMYAKKSLGLRYFPIIDRMPLAPSVEHQAITADPLIFQTTINVQEDKLKQFGDATLSLQRATRAAAGNIRFEFFQETKAPNRFMLFEAYRSEADVSDQVHSQHYQDWRDATIPVIKDLVLSSTRYQPVFPNKQDW